MVVRCLGCDLEFVNPPPDEKTLAEIYLGDMNSSVNGIPFFRGYIEERKKDAVEASIQSTGPSETRRFLR